LVPVATSAAGKIMRINCMGKIAFLRKAINKNNKGRLCTGSVRFYNGGES
jgi:hypothetical protein